MNTTLELSPYQARIRERLAADVKEEIFELVAVNRLNAKEQGYNNDSFILGP
jgi:hypothetical protein